MPPYETDQNASTVLINGRRYPADAEHVIAGVLVIALDALEAVAFQFSADYMKDAATRELYQQNVKRLTSEVIAEVEEGKISVKEGCEYAQEMRNRIMDEARAISSAQGRAKAEAIKEKGKELEELLEAKSEKRFKKPFAALTNSEKSEIHYEIIRSAGRDNAKVTAETKELRVRGRVLLVVTAALAGFEIWVSPDRPRETVHQTLVVGGGAIGGWAAGIAGSFLCGPAELLCMIAMVVIGSSAGGLFGDVVDDELDAEIREFLEWNIR